MKKTQWKTNKNWSVVKKLFKYVEFGNNEKIKNRKYIAI